MHARLLGVGAVVGKGLMPIHVHGEFVVEVRRWVFHVHARGVVHTDGRDVVLLHLDLPVAAALRSAGGGKDDVFLLPHMSERTNRIG